MASRVRLTLLVAPVSWMNRLRLTAVLPATACDGLLVGRRDHASVGHDRDISQLVGIHERTDGRQHRSGLAPVALERVNHQRKPACVGEQPDSDLRLQAAFFGEPGLTEPVPGIGLEVQGGHIVENQ